MDLNNFDKDLIDKIQNHQVHLDKEALWQGINAKRKKKRRFLFLLPILFLGLIASYYLANNLTDNSKMESLQSNVGTTESMQKREQELKEDRATIVDEIQESNTEEKSITKQNAIQTAVEDSDKINENKKTENKLTQNAQNTIVTRSLQRTETIEQRQSAQPERQFPNMEPTTIQSIAKRNESSVPHEITLTSKLSTDVPFLKNETKTEKQGTVLQDAFFLKGSDLYNLDSKIYAYFPSLVEPIQTIEIVENKNRFSLLFAAGYGYAFRNLKSTDTIIEFDEYAELRNNAEKTLDELSIELGLKYHFTKSLYLRSGMQFAQITERFLHTDEYQNMVTERGVVFQLIGPNGEVIESLEGERTGTQVVRDNFTFYNQYRFLDIPLSIGYHPMKGKLGVGIEAGILANISLNFDGHLYDESEVVIQPDNYFKNRIGLRYTLGFPIQYTLKENMRVFARPNFVYSNSGIQTERNSLVQKYKIARLQLGLEYAF